jgi:hypothetical protein
MVRLIYIAAIPVPLFIHPELFIGATASGVKIHWIVIFAPLLLIYVRTIPWTIVGLAAIFVVAFLIGLSEDGNWLRGVYLVQTLVPIAGYFAAIRHETAFRVIVASATLSTLAILALAVSYGAPSEEASVRLAAAIPQFRSYYPFIVVTAIACAAALLNTQRSRAEAIALVVSIAVLVISFALAWSRTGLVMLAIVAVAPILMRRSAFNVALSASIVAGAVVVVMSFSVLADRFTPTNYQRAVEQSDQNRLNYAIEAVERVVASPLTGRAIAYES